MDEFVLATRYALSGLVIGSGVALTADYANQYIMSNINQTSDTMGGLALGVVVGTGMLAGAVMLGDRVMTFVNVGEDPLFRAVYYTTALVNSQSFRQMSSAIQLAGRKSVDSMLATPVTKSTTAKSTCGSGCSAAM